MSSRRRAVAPALPKSCKECRVRQYSVYAALSAEALADHETHLHQRSIFPAKRMLMKEGQSPSEAYVVTFGWLARFKVLPDGRRQILSFLLPGDIAASDRLDEAPIEFSLQALTDVGLCAFDRRELFTRILSEPCLRAGLAALNSERISAAERLIICLGRKSAPERIANLVLNLHERLKARRLICGESYALPLRLEDIADVLGLTPVHVSRTLTQLREDNLFKLQGGVAEIIDRKGLEALAGIN